MMQKILYIVALVVLASLHPQIAMAQLDADACHFWNEAALYNPGTLKPYDYAYLLMRGQQVGFKGQPFNINVGGAMYYDKFQKDNRDVKLHSQFGGNLVYDYAGYTRIGKADFKYAYTITDDFHSFFVNLGLSAGISFFNYDNSKVKVDNTIDEIAFDEKNNYISPNYNFGVEWIQKVGRHYKSDRFVLGASMLNIEDMFNMTEHRNTINSIIGYTAYRKHGMYTFSGGHHRYDLYGGLLMHYYDKSRLQSELHLEAIVTQDEGGIGFDKIVTGASYRRTLQGYGNNDLTINVGYGFSAKFFVGYAFDLVLEDNIKKPFSTHEIFLRYTNITTKKVRCSNPVDGLQYTQW